MIRTEQHGTVLRLAMTAGLASLPVACSAPGSATDWSEGDDTEIGGQDGSQQRARTLQSYDSEALRNLLAQYPEFPEGVEAGRAVGGAALQLGEILKFSATLAEAQDNDSWYGKVTEDRLATAGRGLRAVDHALMAAPADPELLFLKGELHAYMIEGWQSGIVQGRLGRESLEESIQLDPNNPAARLAWAKQYFYLPMIAGRDHDKCLELIDEIVERCPSFEPAWAFRGQVLLGMNRTAEAEASFDRALELNPRSMRANHFLGSVAVEPLR